METIAGEMRLTMAPIEVKPRDGAALLLKRNMTQRRWNPVDSLTANCDDRCESDGRISCQLRVTFRFRKLTETAPNTSLITHVHRCVAHLSNVSLAVRSEYVANTDFCF
jgi:hypothetical protein